VLGVVENMSYAICPDCGRRYDLFGPSKAGELAASIGAPLLARLPIQPGLAELADSGRLGEASTLEFEPVAEGILALLPA
jgi:hypothetical protein